MVFEYGQSSVVWDGSTDSDETLVVSGGVFAIYLPATFAGTTLTVKGEVSDGTFVTVTDHASELPVSVTAGTLNTLPISIFNTAVKRVKFVSSASETLTATLFWRR